MATAPVPGADVPRRGSRSFGYQRTKTKRHQGVDLFAERGTPVLAPSNGVVQQTGEGWRRGFTGYGSIVVLQVPGPRWLLFSHLGDVMVREGQRVTEGEQLGTVGSSRGTATDPSKQFETSAPHIHFEVSPRPYPQPSTASRLDPVLWLRRTKEAAQGPGGAALLAVVVVLAMWFGGRRG